ncbi:FtsB family cell division protein [Acetoanaerobium noterae]|uniref:FtsB family cell division protein n=1 Tax=Acetoanaerobium noterae TaxID=745369 RepID=UPI0028A91702|nr:septum formation initiator family protein [Acetoanaerobium noterae]
MKGKNQDETKISKVLEFKDNQTREESFENINIDNDDLNTKPRDVKKIEDTDKQKKLINLKDKSSKHRNKKSEDKPKKTKKKLDSFDVASAVVIGLLIWAGVSLSFTFIEQQMEISVLNERKLALQTQIKQEEKELKKVKNTLNQMDTLEFIEKQAREKLGMIKPGETVYIDLTKKKN